MTSKTAKKIFKEKIWTTRQMQAIPIVEMKTSHIQNTVRMLQRYIAEMREEMCNGNCSDWINIFVEELARRTEQASITNEIDKVETQQPCI